MTAAAAPPAEPTAEPTTPLEPYRGLVPYSEADYEFFFGRERETEIIRANLRAARLTLLYGESGVGKSSVLLAGAVHKLREEARRNVREPGRRRFAVAVHRTWRDDPLQGLLAAIATSVGELLGDEAAADAPADGRLDEAVKTWTEQLGGDLIVILDQFEEYFLYHGAEDGDGTFAVEFPRAVNRLDLRVSFLVSMREDSLAKLDRFKGRIPFLFDNRLRIDHLGVEAARAAIEGPIGTYNRHVDEGERIAIEPALVDKVIEEISGSRVTLGQTGAGDVNGGSAGATTDRIEAPYLQVVLRRLWTEERQAGSRVLHAATLDRLGGAENIVRTRLDEAMGALDPEERDVAAKVFHYLVTRSGTKVAHTATDLADFAELPPGEVTRVVEHMAAGEVRVLRPVQPPPGVDGGTRYEIFHDVIGPAVLDWRSRHVQEQAKKQAEERARRERRKSRIFAGIAVLSVLIAATVAVLAVFAVRERRSALEQKKEARAQELAAEARTQLAIDPVRSVSLALDSLEVATTEQAERTLREAVPELRATQVVSGARTASAASVSGSEDDPLMAIPGAEHTVRVVAARTGEERAVLRGHEDRVVATAFSPAGDRVVTGSRDGTARVWDVTGEELARFSGEPVLAVAFHPNGDRVVSAAADGFVHLWDAASGAEIARVKAARGIGTLTFDQRGTRLAAASERVGGDVHVWTVGGSKLRPVAVFPAGGVEAAEFDPEGTHLLVAGDGAVRLWDELTGKVTVLSRGDGDVADAGFAPDGTLIAGTVEKTVLVWRTATPRRPIAELHGHRDWVNDLAFRDDGKLLVTASADGTARLWDATTGLSLVELRGHTGSVELARFAADGTLIVTVSEDGTARTWSAETGRELRGHRGWVIDVSFSPDRDTVATGGRDGYLCFWNLQTGARERCLLADVAEEDAVVNSVEYAPDSDAILTAGSDLTVTIWPLPLRPGSWFEQDFLVLSHPGVVGSASFSADGKRVVSTAADGMTRVWDVEKEKVIRRIPTKRAANVDEIVLAGVTDAAFTPGEGSRVVTVFSDGTARVWDARTGEELEELTPHTGVIYSVAFHPEDERLVVTGGRDRVARVWDVETGEEVAALRQPDAVTTASFSPDGNRIVTGSPAGITRIWDWRAGKLVGVMRMHADYVRSAKFSPDGELIASASDDRTARVYACETCGPLSEVARIARERLRSLPRSAR